MWEVLYRTSYDRNREEEVGKIPFPYALYNLNLAFAINQLIGTSVVLVSIAIFFAFFFGSLVFFALGTLVFFFLGILVFFTFLFFFVAFCPDTEVLETFAGPPTVSSSMLVWDEGLGLADGKYEHISSCILRFLRQPTLPAQEDPPALHSTVGAAEGARLMVGDTEGLRLTVGNSVTVSSAVANVKRTCNRIVLIKIMLLNFIVFRFVCKRNHVRCWFKKGIGDFWNF